MKNNLDYYLNMDNIEELNNDELENTSGGFALFLAAVALGYWIAHHNAVQEGRCR